MIQIVLKRNNVRCRERCAVCLAAFEAEAALAELRQDGKDIGYVCPTCLAAGASGMAERASEAAADLGEAARIRQQCAVELQEQLRYAPSVQQYLKACRRYDAEERHGGAVQIGGGVGGATTKWLRGTLGAAHD